MAEDQSKPSFFQQAAKASWLAPIVAVVANLLLRNLDKFDERQAIIGIMLLLLYGLGLTLGIVAMAGISKHGRRGILVPALIGILVNGAILTISISIATSS